MSVCVCVCMYVCMCLSVCLSVCPSECLSVFKHRKSFFSSHTSMSICAEAACHDNWSGRMTRSYRWSLIKFLTSNHITDKQYTCITQTDFSCILVYTFLRLYTQYSVVSVVRA